MQERVEGVTAMARFDDERADDSGWSEEQLRNLEEATRDGIVTVDMSGRIRHANKGFLAMVGYSLEELRSMTYQELTPARWHDYERTIVEQRIVPFGDSGEYEKEYRRKDGTVFPVSLRVWTSRDARGRTTAMFGIVRDITERKHAEVFNAQLAAIVENSDDAILSIDLAGVIQTWNDGATRLYGHVAQEVIGQPVTRLIPNDRMAEESELLSLVAQGKSVKHFDTERLHKDGTVVPIPLTISPIRDAAGTVVGGYQVVKKLAAGGFGVVYLAEDDDRRLVALKEYLPASLAERSPGELTPRVKPDKLPLYRLGLKSFFEEGRSLAQISHPSVVSVLNFFRENETVYMVMNYLQGDTLQDFIVTARDLKRDKVFRESSIRSLFDEILRGLRIVHQHKMLHLDIKPANIFITDDNRAVLIDFGAAREVLSKEGNFIRPMYTPGFAAPEMYRRDGTLGPWTDIYAIGACIYACMQGYPPNDAPQRLEKDRLNLSLSRLRNVYSDNLLEVTEWCMSLDPLSRPQSVFALQKELARETERRYTKLSFSERLKLQLENLKTGAKA